MAVYATLRVNQLAQLLRYCKGLAAIDYAFRHVLLLKFSLVSLMALSFVAAAQGRGWVHQLITSEGSEYTCVIVAVFVVGLVWSFQTAHQISNELNEVHDYENENGPRIPYVRLLAQRTGTSRALLASTLKLRLVARISPVKHIANSLVLLGLIGTVIGFIVALSGVDPRVASEVTAIGPMISTLIEGMAIALYTTLVGSLLHVWLMVHVRMLEGATVKLLAQTVELGEKHVS